MVTLPMTLSDPQTRQNAKVHGAFKIARDFLETFDK